MKIANALLAVCLAGSTTEAVKIERRAVETEEVERDLRYKGKNANGSKNGGKMGKSDDALFDPVCLASCEAQCALPDCIPLDASVAPSEAGKGKGKGKSGESKSGKGKSGGSKNGKGKNGKGKSGNNRFGGKGKGKSGSEAPSYFCSEAPSVGPSLTPSTSPSAIPSTSPSTSPSAMPSTSPSTSPSAMPSTSPSDLPSATPSTSPSDLPSATPSDVPSSMPTEIQCGFDVITGDFESIWDAATAVSAYTPPAGYTCQLASITNQAEQDAVEALVSGSTFFWTGGMLAIGGSPGNQCGKNAALDSTEADTMLCANAGWGWTDGSDWTYQNWTPAQGSFDPQPDNFDAMTMATQVIVVVNGDSGTWNDVRQAQSNIDGGAIVKCCQSTTSDVTAGGNVVDLPTTVQIPVTMVPP